MALEFFYSNLLLAKRNWNREIIYIIQNVKLMKTVIGWITMKNTFQSPIQTSGFHCHSVKRWNILLRMSQYKQSEVLQLSANNYLKLPAKRKTQLSPLFFLHKAEKSWVSLWWPMYERKPPIRTPPSPPFTLASQNAELRRVSCIHGQLLEILAPDFFSSHVLYFVSAVSSISTRWLAS